MSHCQTPRYTSRDCMASDHILSKQGALAHVCSGRHPRKWALFSCLHGAPRLGVPLSRKLKMFQHQTSVHLATPDRVFPVQIQRVYLVSHNCQLSAVCFALLASASGEALRVVGLCMFPVSSMYVRSTCRFPDMLQYSAKYMHPTPPKTLKMIQSAPPLGIKENVSK